MALLTANGEDFPNQRQVRPREDTQGAVTTRAEAPEVSIAARMKMAEGKAKAWPHTAGIVRPLTTEKAATLGDMSLL